MRNSERVRIIEWILLFIIVGLPVFLLTFGLYYLFLYLQENAFVGAQDIAIIPDEYTQICFIIIGVIAFLLIYSRHDFGVYVGKYIERYRKIKPLNIIIFSAFIFLATLIYFFNSNSVISTNGIRCNNIILKTADYKWNDFEGGTIYISDERKRRNIRKDKFHYVLNTKDKKTFEIRNTKNFWDKILIINNTVEKNNIQLKKFEITNFGFAVSLLVDDYNGTDLDNGIEILRKLGIYTGNIPPESPYTQLMKEILK